MNEVHQPALIHGGISLRRFDLPYCSSSMVGLVGAIAVELFVPARRVHTLSSNDSYRENVSAACHGAPPQCVPPHRTLASVLPSTTPPLPAIAVSPSPFAASVRQPRYSELILQVVDRSFQRSKTVCPCLDHTVAIHPQVLLHRGLIWQF